MDRSFDSDRTYDRALWDSNRDLTPLLTSVYYSLQMQAFCQALIPRPAFSSL